jgi:hypothetical protein
VAFSQFVTEVEPRLRRALVALRGAEAGRDATAEALAWAWEHWPEVEAMANPAGYLYRVGQSRSRWKPERFAPAVVAPTDGFGFEPGLVPALARLSDRQRTAVVLVHGCGWSLQEVADALDCRSRRWPPTSSERWRSCATSWEQIAMDDLEQQLRAWTDATEAAADADPVTAEEAMRWPASRPRRRPLRPAGAGAVAGPGSPRPPCSWPSPWAVRWWRSQAATVATSRCGRVTACAVVARPDDGPADPEADPRRVPTGRPCLDRGGGVRGAARRARSRSPTTRTSALLRCCERPPPRAAGGAVAHLRPRPDPVVDPAPARRRPRRAGGRVDRGGGRLVSPKLGGLRDPDPSVGGGRGAPRAAELRPAGGRDCVPSAETHGARST